MTRICKIASRFVLGLFGALSIISCQVNPENRSNEDSVRGPTPTLFGTAITTSVPSDATSTPLPKKIPDVCVFPVFNEEIGQNDEAAVYRFNWVSGEKNLEIETRGGPITIQGPVNLTSGTRRLLIVHRYPPPEILSVSSKLKPESNLLYDTNTDAAEIRTKDGDILSQTIYDDAGDIGNLKPALDIISVERQFAEDGGYIVRLTTNAPNDGIYETSFENIELRIGSERYAHRILNNGKIVNLKYDAEGNYNMWDGTVISQGNTITWVLDEGSDVNFTVRTATDISIADKTSMFPTDKMDTLWKASQSACR